MDDGAQPRCPDDGTLLRDVPGGWLCAVCGYREDAPEVVMPEVEGPHLPGW